jgi:hypothetical protein
MNTTSTSQQSRDISKFCLRHDVDINAIKEWIELYKNDVPFAVGLCFPLNSNCPVDDNGIDNIQSYINNHDLSTSPSSNDDWIKLINNVVLNSLKRKSSQRIKMRAI